MDKELAYIQGMLSIGFMKGLRNRLPSIAQLKKQNMHNVAWGRALGGDVMGAAGWWC